MANISFNGYFQGTTVGEPVPAGRPYDIVARITDTNGNVVASVVKKIYVTQVIKVDYEDGAMQHLMNKLTYTNDQNVVTNLYNGCDFSSAFSLLQVQLPKMIEKKFPGNANIRVVGRDATVQQAGHVLKIVSSSNTNDQRLGYAALNERNSDPNLNPASDPATTFAAHIRRFIHNQYDAYMNETDPEELAKYEYVWARIPSPIQLGDLAKLYANLGAHESGHMVGLVSRDYLGGKYDDHNPANQPWLIMNYEPWLVCLLEGFRQENGKEFEMEFNDLNTCYLNWFFPKP